jgi:alkylation response protein AidB-like acyl-CoA dehydrogenase
MFELAIRYLGDDEQVKQWLPLITKCKIIGNYSQTELGHGSNVRVSCDVKYNAVEDTNLIIILGA